MRFEFEQVAAVDDAFDYFSHIVRPFGVLGQVFEDVAHLLARAFRDSGFGWTLRSVVRHIGEELARNIHALLVALRDLVN